MPSEQPYPINEMIIRTMVDELKGISVANGYRNNVAHVDRPRPGIGNMIKDRFLSVYQRDPQPATGSIGMTTWEQVISIFCVVQQSEDTTEAISIDERLNTLRADVEKRLCGESPDADITHGGFALNTTPLAPEYADVAIDASEGAVTVNVMVLYRHVQGNPYRLS